MFSKRNRWWWYPGAGGLWNTTGQVIPRLQEPCTGLYMMTRSNPGLSVFCPSIELKVSITPHLVMRCFLFSLDAPKKLENEFVLQRIRRGWNNLFPGDIFKWGKVLNFWLYACYYDWRSTRDSQFLSQAKDTDTAITYIHTRHGKS